MILIPGQTMVRHIQHQDHIQDLIIQIPVVVLYVVGLIVKLSTCPTQVTELYDPVYDPDAVYV